jgi:hypothetical protein
MKIKAGDIVSVPYRFQSVYTHGLFTVKERNGELGINILTDRKGWYNCPEDIYEWRPVNSDMEVAGNIKDYPELIEEPK